MRRKLGFESLESRALLTSFSSSLLKDITPGAESSQFSNFRPAGDKLLFNVGVGDVTAVQQDLWITDGTTAGTKILAEDIRPFLFDPFESQGQVIFAGQSTAGSALWFSDGTAAGSMQFKVDLVDGNVDPVDGETADAGVVVRAATSDEGDINGGGDVSFADFLLLSANFGKS